MFVYACHVISVLCLASCFGSNTTEISTSDQTCVAGLPTGYIKLLDIDNATCSAKQSEKVSYVARNFDFVFAIEISPYYNQTRLSCVKEALQELISVTQSSNYGDYSVRYAFVFYPVVEGHSQMVTTSFRKHYSRGDLDAVFNMAVNYAIQLDHATEYPSTIFLRHLTVFRSLKTLYELTNYKPTGLSLVDIDKEIVLNFRKASEKHLIIILDLFKKIKKGRSKQDDGKRQFETEIDNLITSIKSRINRPSNFVLTAVLDPTDKVATTSYGDPRYAQMYSDGTHFNKAMTLKALLKAKNEQSNTLQAHLLHKGLHMQVMRLKQLRSFYRALNPALWMTDSVYGGFIDRCARPNQKNCAFCSTLHGCYQPKSGKVPHTEKYEMSPKFAAGGHGSMKTVNYTSNKVNEEQLTIYSSPLSPGSGVQLSSVVIGGVTELQWSPNKPFAETIINAKQPVVLKNSVVATWPALTNWTVDYFKKHLSHSAVLDSVKCSNSFLTFDPDSNVPLKLNISIPFTTANMTKEDFFSCLHNECTDDYKGHYYFGAVPDQLKEDMINDHYLYLTDKDYKTSKQFVWVSSAGMITHAHFDQDYNFFVQISGKKRFTLWSSVQHELLYMYPRVHPMWHKSRVNFKEIDPQRFPLFLKSQAVQVTMGPADLLYIPPYTWHYVETLTPSISLSTWSHDYRLYDNMNSIYKYDHKFDELANRKGRMFALRMFLDMMVHDLYGFNDTSHFFAHLLAVRFAGLEHLFPPAPRDEEICTSSVPGKIPTCVHIHGYVQLDMAVVAPHFESLAVEVRDILFMDYVEEISAEIVGVDKMLAFFRYCFVGQDYYVTEMGSKEHADLWQPL